MTKEDFKAWTDVTRGSRLSWRIDTSRWNSNRELLFYSGDQDGKFIWIYPDGMLHAGIYEGAGPNLLEATFQPTFTKKFATREDAYKRVVECGGIQFVFQQLVDRPALLDCEVNSGYTLLNNAKSSLQGAGIRYDALP